MVSLFAFDIYLVVIIQYILSHLVPLFITCNISQSKVNSNNRWSVSFILGRGIAEFHREEDMGDVEMLKVNGCWGALAFWLVHGGKVLVQLYSVSPVNRNQSSLDIWKAWQDHNICSTAKNVCVLYSLMQDLHLHNLLKSKWHVHYLKKTRVALTYAKLTVIMVLSSICLEK